jgi:SpoVK/Ycf46/Vps4 family AAA+-type ATPase
MAVDAGVRTILPPGVVGLHVLPADHHDGPWDSIIVPDDVKQRLLATAVMVLRHGRRLAGTPIAPHGLILLAGPPGTGKSTLALGLATMAARRLAGSGATTLVEVDPHAFPSEMLGESQRAVARFFGDTLLELAARRPHTIVVVDEIESLAVRRAAASFETNPVDVMRATDALLAGLDRVRAERPGTLMVATTNFPDAIDEAFSSRADLTLHTTLPDEQTIALIVTDTLRLLAEQWPALRALATDTGLHRRVAERLRGCDGRRVRKAVHGALTLRLEVADDPARLTERDIMTSATQASAD